MRRTRAQRRAANKAKHRALTRENRKWTGRPKWERRRIEREETAWGNPRRNPGNHPPRIKTISDAYRSGESEGRGDYTGSGGWPYADDFKDPDKYVKAWMEGWSHGDAERRWGGTPGWVHEEERPYGYGRNPGRVRRRNPYLKVGRRRVWVAPFTTKHAFRLARPVWPGRR